MLQHTYLNLAVSYGTYSLIMIRKIVKNVENWIPRDKEVTMEIKNDPRKPIYYSKITQF